MVISHVHMMCGCVGVRYRKGDVYIRMVEYDVCRCIKCRNS